MRNHPRAFVDVNVTGTLNLLDAAVSAGHDRFVFTSTTSLMISRVIREEEGSAAIWLDETSGPLAPRNIYGVTYRPPPLSLLPTPKRSSVMRRT